MSKSKLVVTLDLYYGQPTYDFNRNVTSRKEPVKLIYGSQEWENFLKHLNVTGITKVDVLKAFDLTEKKEVDDISEIKKEVESYFMVLEVPLTPDQIKIQELQRKIDELTSSTKPAESKTKVADAVKAAKENTKPAESK